MSCLNSSFGTHNLAGCNVRLTLGQPSLTLPQYCDSIVHMNRAPIRLSLRLLACLFGLGLLARVSWQLH
ncbi:unnamed protein product [Mycetohabitans rhizoxinica HKI 454]|uniref:Uncharacterized protein n=1 Tax=Mycetohabitans rhizoxinica (strain DSM 19002 / CIP 109453 / HKI 454) TaxID=882378 RepID=E5ASK9_MYCRK|nr:unnamed protein product [Mycetohabitans rhizoxinica HKI 454]